LGQVASIISPDPDRAQALRQLPLGRAPQRPTLLPAREIQERIASATADAVVVGGRIALLPENTIPRDEQWFYTALLSFLEQQDTFKQGRIELDLSNRPLFLEGLRQDVLEEQTTGWQDRIVFEADKSPYGSGFKKSISSQTLPAGTMQLNYRIILPQGSLISGREQVEGSFRVWIHHYLPVARAAVDLIANQQLSEQVLIFTQEDISMLRGSFFLQGEETGSYKTVASIRRGDRIQPERLQRFLAVRAGDKVKISFARPGLLISLPGRAFRSGAVGDIINVRPDATTRRFQARITSQGEVLVESY
jgi:flagella basal body P-ring formation protein FlgA